MKYLMDTHVFIFWDRAPKELPPTVVALFNNPDAEVFLSIASIWEMQIKIQLGKLRFSKPLDQFIEDQFLQNQLQLLPIELRHIYALDQLPHHHRDPFDRLLIAQAIHEDMTLVTNDGTIMQYPVKYFW